MRKKVWIGQGDIVLVGLRDYQDEKADVILKYSADEARVLKQYGELPEHLRINDTDVVLEGEDNENAGMKREGVIAMVDMAFLAIFANQCFPPTPPCTCLECSEFFDFDGEAVIGSAVPFKVPYYLLLFILVLSVQILLRSNGKIQHKDQTRPMKVLFFFLKHVDPQSEKGGQDKEGTAHQHWQCQLVMRPCGPWWPQR
jgi:hypothetical protein